MILKSIKEQLDSLDPEKRRLLMYAFEHDMAQFVEIDDNSYIGVNTSNLKNLTVEQCAGNWYAGKIKKSS